MGVNFHTEESKVVASILNIQGKDGDVVKSFREHFGNGNYWPVEVLTFLLQEWPADINIVRGVSSSKHPSNGRNGFDIHRASNLYDRTFRSLGMEPIRDKTGNVRYYELVR